MQKAEREQSSSKRINYLECDQTLRIVDNFRIFPDLGKEVLEVPRMRTYRSLKGQEIKFRNVDKWCGVM